MYTFNETVAARACLGFGLSYAGAQHLDGLPRNASRAILKRLGVETPKWPRKCGRDLKSFGLISGRLEQSFT